MDRYPLEAEVTIWKNNYTCKHSNLLSMVLDFKYVDLQGVWNDYQEDWVMKWAPAILKVANINEIKVSDDEV